MTMARDSVRTRELASSFLSVPQVTRLRDERRALGTAVHVRGPESIVSIVAERLRDRGWPTSDGHAAGVDRIDIEIAPKTPWRSGGNDEAYRLEIRALPEGGVHFLLAGGSRRAVRYGMRLIESFRAAGSCRLGVIEDWPAFPMRGIVEGFYGVPWSNPQRLDMMSFLAENKFNSYIYAPKADPYHRSRWREPYPAPLLFELEQQIRHAEALDVAWAFAVSPGLSLRYTSEDDSAALLAKLEAVYDLGARHFGLFFDDVPNHLVDERDRRTYASLAEAQTQLVQRLHQRFQHADRLVHMFICPTVYAGNGDSDYLRHLGQHLPAGVDVFWTGPAICSERITGDTAAGLADVLGRPPVLWDNYPVNDGVMGAELHMAPYVGRADDLHRAVRGVFANPMTLPEASKVPLSCVGAYAWNPRRYRANAVWEEAIKEVAGPAARAFERFSACNPMSILYEQPKVLLAAAEAFKRDFWSGDFAGALDRIESFFVELDRDVASIPRDLPNAALLREIEPWLEDMRHWCAVGIHAARAYRVAVDLLASKGQHPAATSGAPAPAETAAASSAAALEALADEVERALEQALVASVGYATKAGGYVIRDFSFDALHALRAIRRA
jgi:hyaluronoglucosaminidase